MQTGTAVQTLKAVLVGCGGMGSNQAKILSSAPDYRLAAVCDAYEPNLKKVSDAMNVPGYRDLGEMLAAEKPDVVAICTHNAAHAPMTIQAAEAGVRGIYCEKPMATNLKDAREMTRVCRERGAKLVVNHQRRIGADLIEARRMIERGDLGEIRLVRGQCGGDVLSDGTHIVDSVLFMLGDPEADSIFGTLHRELEVDASRKDHQRKSAEPKSADAYQAKKASDLQAGVRYGHAVETGSFGIVRFKNGVRFEIACGDMRESGCAYQDYQVIGTRGRLWRCGDRAEPNLFVSDAKGGTWEAGSGEFGYMPYPAKDGGAGAWRPVPVERERSHAIGKGYELLARAIHDGTEHPMRGETALRGFEIIMGLYESARLRKTVFTPVAQERFPLDLMIEAGLL
ncbi:MAG: Gfo/Idh/MocA family oxidoreductase [Planctomycetota bacterium]|nr:Gfo/Idh/MocA family oxidoreductase [Planctomycetota bacterium]